VTTILCTNRKGGAGKTAVAVNIAAAYAQGTRTLLIDLDPQGDASAWLGIEDSGEALADALAGRTGLGPAIKATPSGVDVAAGGEALGYLSGVGRDAVRAAVESVRVRRYRNVLIDCPPSLSPLVLAAWCVAEDVIGLVPVDGPAAFRAVTRLRNAWDDAGLDLSRLRVVLTRHDRRRLLDQALVRQAESLLGGAVLQSRIRESVVVPESAGWHRPLVLHAPRHAVAEDFRAVAREVSDV
jgi:chromosome partitioning protein